MLFPAAVASLALCNIAYALRAFYIAAEVPLRVDAEESPSTVPLVSVIVPARNEERSIERCVRALMAQRYGNLEIIVIDDESEDSTVDVAARLSAEDSRVRLVRGAPLPHGWVGKPWAIVQGVRVASGAWLLFTDADMVFEPSAVGAALAFEQRQQASAVSLLPEQILVTPAERVLMPTIVWTIGFATGRLSAVNNPSKPNALFSGGFILAERHAYEAVGGHEAVRGTIAEDFELAHRFKADGRFRTILASGAGVIRVRMYHSFREIWDGFVKNFALGARGNVGLAVAGAIFLALISPVTPLGFLAALALHRWGDAMALGLSSALTLAAVAAAFARFGLTARAVVWFPVAMPVLVAIVATSLARHTRGGVTWRGRTYDSTQGEVL